MAIELTLQERELLEQILEEYLMELQTEIHDTDNREYKLQLRMKVTAIRDIIQKLEQTVVLADA